MKNQDNIDTIYYKNSLNNSISLAVLIHARERMFRDFMSHAAPHENTKIVDIGVSDEENEGSNFLEKLYPWPENITCAGIGNGQDIQTAFPKSRFVHIEPDKALPFANHQFDIAYSNAVLEHVGGAAQRMRFIQECLRVAQKVFIFVPNRWFPVEHHTNIPLLHYYPALFRSLTKQTTLSFWSDPMNMDFIGKNELEKAIADAGGQIETCRYTGIALGPLSSNILALVKK